MIRVDIIRQSSPTKWEWRATAGGAAASGLSHQPLLDACRAFQRMGEPDASVARLFWPGKDDWAMECSVGWGADHTVVEDRRGSRFGKWRSFEMAEDAE